MRRIVQYVIIALYLAGLMGVITGIAWTRTMWSAYVYRGADFNWWGPASILIGLVMVIMAYRLDSRNQ